MSVGIQRTSHWLAFIAIGTKLGRVETHVWIAGLTPGCIHCGKLLMKSCEDSCTCSGVGLPAWSVGTTDPVVAEDAISEVVVVSCRGRGCILVATWTSDTEQRFRINSDQCAAKGVMKHTHLNVSSLFDPRFKISLHHYHHTKFNKEVRLPATYKPPASRSLLPAALD